jgi:hypothetical protein
MVCAPDYSPGNEKRRMEIRGRRGTLVRTGIFSSVDRRCIRAELRDIVSATAAARRNVLT